MAQTQADFTVGWHISLLIYEKCSANGENVVAALKKKKNSPTPATLKNVFRLANLDISRILLLEMKDSACQEDLGENSHSMPTGLDWGRDGLDSVCESKKGTIEGGRPVSGNIS